MTFTITPAPETIHYLTANDGAILAGSCMIVGCFMTMIGFKIAPTVKRYLALIRLKIFMFKWG